MYCGWQLRWNTAQHVPVHPPLAAGGEATTPAAVRQSIFSEQQLAAVAASLNKLPRQPGVQSWRGGDVLPEGGLPALQRVSEADEAVLEAAEHRRHQQQRFRASLEREAEREAAERAAAEAQRAQRRASRRGSEQGSQREEAAAAQLRRSVTSADQGLSGFTVYTNSLQAADKSGPGDADAGEVAQPPCGSHAARHSASAPASVVGGERDSHGSGVQWRSISSAALSTRSLGSLDGQEGEAEGHERGRQAGRASLPGSRAGSQARQQLGSLEAAAQAVAAGASWEQEQAGRLQAYAKQLSQLMLPGVDASQVGGWHVAGGLAGHLMLCMRLACLFGSHTLSPFCPLPTHLPNLRLAPSCSWTAWCALVPASSHLTTTSARSAPRPMRRLNQQLGSGTAPPTRCCSCRVSRKATACCAAPAASGSSRAAAGMPAAQAAAQAAGGQARMADLWPSLWLRQWGGCSRAQRPAAPGQAASPRSAGRRRGRAASGRPCCRCPSLRARCRVPAPGSGEREHQCVSNGLAQCFALHSPFASHHPPSFSPIMPFLPHAC